MIKIAFNVLEVSLSSHFNLVNIGIILYAQISMLMFRKSQQLEIIFICTFSFEAFNILKNCRRITSDTFWSLGTK